GLSNAVTGSESRTSGKIICSNIFTYFNLIFFILAAVLLYEHSYNNLTFLGVVVANTVIGIVQELRSKKELEKLQLVNEPEATVIRDAKQKRIPSEELVQDDIVLFVAGNQICADAVICEGVLRVNESLITGEADEVEKKIGDSLLSGSFVVSGQAKVRLTQVGDNSFSAKLSKSARKIKKYQRPGMMKSLTRLIQTIGIIIIPFAALIFWNQHFVLEYSEKISVENTAAAIIGMIPEDLYLLTSIALAASTIRLARQNTLVHDMKCIETLAKVDTVCRQNRHNYRITDETYGNSVSGRSI
ncbi:MAG: HAD-IC family P-type ATPase, partial [Lachnospiraceae bacterium]